MEDWPSSVFNDAHCCIFEMVNNDNELRIGFQSFLKDCRAEEDLKKIIEDKEVVEICWPDCVISSAKETMKRAKYAVKNIVPARVRAYGGRLLMREKLGNLLKYGKTTPERNERGAHARKTFDDFVTGKKLSAYAITKAKSITKCRNNQASSGSYSKNDGNPLEEENRKLREELRKMEEWKNAKENSSQQINENHEERSGQVLDNKGEGVKSSVEVSPRRKSRSPYGSRSKSPLGSRSKSPLRNRSRSPTASRSRSSSRRSSRSSTRRSRSPIAIRSGSSFTSRSRSPIGNCSRSSSMSRSRSSLSNRSRSSTASRSRSPSGSRSGSRSRSISRSPSKRRSRSRFQRSMSRSQRRHEFSAIGRSGRHAVSPHRRESSKHAQRRHDSRSRTTRREQGIVHDQYPRKNDQPEKERIIQGRYCDIKDIRRYICQGGTKKLTTELARVVFGRKILEKSSLSGRKSTKNGLSKKKLPSDMLNEFQEYINKKCGRHPNTTNLFRAGITAACHNADKAAKRRS